MRNSLLPRYLPSPNTQFHVPTTRTADDDDGEDVKGRRLRRETAMLDTVGRGASGVVRRALHVPLLRIVAVKENKW